jgi:zinc/manganese transport system ATP-binding protein
MTRPVAIALREVCVRVGMQRVLDGVSAQFARGSMTVVTGPNGAGKTTLLETLAGVRRPESGRVERASGNCEVALLRQRHELRLDVPCTVTEFVALGRWHSMGMWSAWRDADADRLRSALLRLGLLPLAQRQLATLSPGELQRARFAQLMLRDADVVLLDEPFAALDQQATTQLAALLKSWHVEGRTVIAVLHDLAPVSSAFPHTLSMRPRVLPSGEIMELLLPVAVEGVRTA